MKNKKEIQIGETVQMRLVTLVCEKEESEYSCVGCYAMHKYGMCSTIGECRGEFRTDKKDVIFKLKED